MIEEGKPFEGLVMTNPFEDLVMTNEEERVFDSVESLHDYFAVAIERVTNEIPSSRERSLVITKLQEADMWLEHVPLS